MELNEHLMELRKILKKPTLKYITVSGIEVSELPKNDQWNKTKLICAHSILWKFQSEIRKSSLLSGWRLAREYGSISLPTSSDPSTCQTGLGRLIDIILLKSLQCGSYFSLRECDIWHRDSTARKREHNIKRSCLLSLVKHLQPSSLKLPNIMTLLWFPSKLPSSTVWCP